LCRFQFPLHYTKPRKNPILAALNTLKINKEINIPLVLPKTTIPIYGSQMVFLNQSLA